MTLFMIGKDQKRIYAKEDAPEYLNYINEGDVVIVEGKSYGVRGKVFDVDDNVVSVLIVPIIELVKEQNSEKDDDSTNDSEDPLYS